MIEIVLRLESRGSVFTLTAMINVLRMSEFIASIIVSVKGNDDTPLN